LIRDSVRNAAYAIAPQFVVDRYIRSKMLRQARQIGQLGGCTVDRSLVDALWSSHFFRPLQKESEILRLIEVVRTIEPSRICEIGAAGGGTTLLLARAATRDATIVTIDLGFTNVTEAAVHHFVGSQQKMFCLTRDSHHSETVAEVTKCVEGSELDVLYLDGDHSYEGIQADFKLYNPLVRRGGLIVFHDIVPDYKTRFGITTTSDVGGVPQFWEEIKAAGATVEEIIDDPEQDGYGIGILRWNPSSS
jgi:predicted O-methyltransferase YrrM